MKIRTCDYCQKTIEGDFYKICFHKKKQAEKYQADYTLTYAGDLCPNCWDNIKLNKKGNGKNE